jgi:hypothetical protein
MTKRVIAALGASAAMLLGIAGTAGATQEPISSREARLDRQKADNPNQVVCVRYEFTGSRLPQRTCRTRAEWERDGGIPRDQR